VEYEWSTSGVQAEYRRSTVEYKWSTSGVQAEYSGVQAEYVKYGGLLEYRSPAFSPLLLWHEKTITSINKSLMYSIPSI
jgi:hypothetical protein